MGMIDLKQVQIKKEQLHKNEDIIKEEFREMEDEAFEEYHKNAKEEFNGRAKFNGKLLAIISAVILIIAFIIYMCNTTISEVVEKNTGESVISADAKMFIIDTVSY